MSDTLPPPGDPGTRDDPETEPAETVPAGEPAEEPTEPAEPLGAEPAPSAPEVTTGPIGTGDPEAVAQAQADHQAAVDEHSAALAAAQSGPYVDVSMLDPAVSNPGVSVQLDRPSGEPAEVKVVTDSGVSFFHSLTSLPRRFLDAAGNVILGRHHGVDAEGNDVTAP